MGRRRYATWMRAGANVASGHSTGEDVMKRAAAPMAGDLASLFVLELLVYEGVDCQRTPLSRTLELWKGGFVMNRFLFIPAIALSLGTVGCGQQSAQQTGPREIHLEVTERGFVPAEAVIQKGEPVTLVVTRKTDQTCATEIVLPKLNQRHALPLNHPVRIAIPAGVQDTLNYTCGMNMLGGAIVAR